VSRFPARIMRMLKVYGFPISQPTRSVLMLLSETENALEFVPVNIMTGENKETEFLTVNPPGLGPAIDDDGFCLGESAAIMQYLAETRGMQSFYPTDPRVRARVNSCTTATRDCQPKRCSYQFYSNFLPTSTEKRRLPSRSSS
jgi:glutathione S-transferase